MGKTIEHERLEIQRLLVEIDRKMAQEVEKSGKRVPRLRVKDYSFPWALWILTGLVMAWWAFGEGFFPALNEAFFRYAFYIGLLGVVVSGIRTLQWAWRHISYRTRIKKEGPAQQENEALRELRQERRKLMERLDKLKDMEK